MIPDKGFKNLKEEGLRKIDINKGEGLPKEEDLQTEEDLMIEEDLMKEENINLIEKKKAQSMKI